MRLNRNRGFIAQLWILCIICTAILGICFDNTQTDSCLAYQDIISGGIDNVGASVLLSPQKGVQTQQAYVPESFGLGSYALAPRKTTQRTNPRSVFGSALFILLPGIFSSSLFFGQTAFFSDGICGVISNTVILRYIHGKDGAKA